MNNEITIVFNNEPGNEQEIKAIREVIISLKKKGSLISSKEQVDNSVTSICR